MKEFTLTLIRHGISQANEDHKMVGWKDVDLSQSGIDELIYYRDHIKYPKSDRYYCSSLLRARHTFDILFSDHETVYEYSDQLREHGLGSFEDHDVGPNYIFPQSFFKLWTQHINQADEETIDNFQKRILTKIQCIVNECLRDHLHSAAVIAHAGVIRIILLSLQNRPYSNFFDIKIPNGLGVILKLNIDNERISLSECTFIK